MRSSNSLSVLLVLATIHLSAAFFINRSTISNVKNTLGNKHVTVMGMGESETNGVPFFSEPDDESSKKTKEAKGKGEGVETEVKADDAKLDLAVMEKEVIDLTLMEKEVLAATQAKLDVQRVKDVVFGAGNTDIDLKKFAQKEANSLPDTPPPSPLNIGFAAAFALASLSYFAFDSSILSFVVFLATFYIASKDPLSDEEIPGGEFTGPVTRIVGRATLDSIEKSKPTVQAVARAVVTRDELDNLKKQYEELEGENEDLKSRIQLRQEIDKQAKKYTIKALKEIAKENDLKTGGTKAELMMRLVDEGCLVLEE